MILANSQEKMYSTIPALKSNVNILLLVVLHGSCVEQ